MKSNSYQELMRELEQQSRDHFARMDGAPTVRSQVPSEAHTLTVRGSNPRAATNSDNESLIAPSWVAKETARRLKNQLEFVNRINTTQYDADHDGWGERRKAQQLLRDLRDGRVDQHTATTRIRQKYLSTDLGDGWTHEKING